MLPLQAVKAVAGSAAKVAASKLCRPVPFHGLPTVSPICPASGAAYSRAALPVSSRRHREVVAEAEVRADPLEQVLVAPLEADRAGRRLRAAQAPEVLLEPADLVVREALVDAVLAPLEGSAAVDAPTRLSIPRMAKFPTQWLLARSPTT